MVLLPDCAHSTDESISIPKIRVNKSVTSCPCVRCFQSQIDGVRRLQQYLCDLVIGRALGPGVAADADTLFSASRPEPSSFLLQGFAIGIDKFELDWLIGRDMQEERAVGLYR